MPLNSAILPKLPISEVLEHIQQCLALQHELVLEAPPGAGKTTLVPLAILQEQERDDRSPAKKWLAGQRIVMLEPRRMAARAAAQRMASLLNEPVGHTIGYRIRQETRISKQTRIEVITEGILTRMLLQDPTLEGIGLLIFDEFHERSLDADFGLALALQSRQLFREAKDPLRLMVMSATLDGAAIATLLGDSQANVNKATIIRSAGKMFPVEVIYGKAKRYDDNIVEIVVNTVLNIISNHSGSLLVFLPGQGEINKVLQQLNGRLSALERENSIILPLYGALPLREQQRAIEPLADTERESGKRKIVLATDIAETSITIEGITIVVDAGLCREPRFDPATGMTRLQTRRISKNASIQRMGRAGRLAAGCCYRLWSEEQQHQLAQHSTAQILQADLAPLVLQLLAWGIDDISELKWLDLPPARPLKQALELLDRLGAISKKSTEQQQSSSLLRGLSLSSHGELMAAMPVHPRLAHMLLCSQPCQQTDIAAALAALLTERNPLRGADSRSGSDYGAYNTAYNTAYNSADVSHSLAVVMGDLPCHSQHKNWLKRTRQQAKTFKQLIENFPLNKDKSDENTLAQSSTTLTGKTLAFETATGFLLACAYPDRIAQRKFNSKNHYLLSNGRTAMLNQKDSSGNSEWLAIAELGGSLNGDGKSNNDRIFSASAFDPKLLDDQLSELVEKKDTVLWDEKADRFIAEQLCLVGKLVITRQRIENIPAEAKRVALIGLVKKRGLSILPWSKSIRQWQARVMLLHALKQEGLNTVSRNSEREQSQKSQWPNVSDQYLLATIEQWLGPYLEPITKLSDFQKLDLQAILTSLLPWPLPQQLKELAPGAITVPSGSNINIDYTQQPPVLSVKLQEMFGCQTTPTIANGQVKLMLHLLSPAQRPLQVTQDLAGFWHSSYFDVKKDMKGRYPKHPWPDNPMQAIPTKSIKQR